MFTLIVQFIEPAPEGGSNDNLILLLSGGGEYGTIVNNVVLING